MTSNVIELMQKTQTHAKSQLSIVLDIFANNLKDELSNYFLIDRMFNEDQDKQLVNHLIDDLLKIFSFATTQLELSFLAEKRSRRLAFIVDGKARGFDSRFDYTRYVFLKSEEISKILECFQYDDEMRAIFLRLKDISWLRLYNNLLYMESYYNKGV